jgi:HK97 family phage major capsid protein
MAVSRDTIKELRGQRLQLANQRSEILDLTTRENRDLTGEEQERFDRWNTDDEKLERRINLLEAELDKQDKLGASQGVLAGRSDSAEDDGDIQPKKRETGKREGFLGAWARWRALKSHQRAAYIKANGLSGRNLDALQDASIGSNGFIAEADNDTGEARALSALSDTAGAYTIEPELETTLIAAVLSWGGLLRAPIYKFTTATGVDLGYLLDDDTANEGEWIAENIAVGTQDVSFSKKTLKSYTVSSKLVLVPLELLQDTSIDLEAYLNERFAIRIGRALNSRGTTGTGVGCPTGIVTSATVGKTAAATGAVTWQEMLALKHSVDPDYRAQGSGWSFNDTTLLAIKSMVDGFGRPLWQPNVIVGEPPQIDGDPYWVNQSMASMATTTKPILYGAMRYYYLRSVQGVSFVRLVERYAEARQIGFFAFQRHDGLLMNPGGTNNPVKCLQMA